MRQEPARCWVSDLELVPKAELTIAPNSSLFGTPRAQRLESFCLWPGDRSRQTESGLVPVPENCKRWPPGRFEKALSNVIAEQARSAGGVIQRSGDGGEP